MNFLDRNEFNFQPSQEVVDAIKNFDIGNFCFYTRIYDQGKKSIFSVYLSEMFGIDEPQVLLGYGAEDLLKNAVHYFLTKGDNKRMLIPPNWMRIIMTTCPFTVKQADVLTTPKPVMQLALVAVNRASMNDMPFVVIRGISNKMVPRVMSSRKEPTIKPGGLMFILPKMGFIFVNSMITMIKK